MSRDAKETCPRCGEYKRLSKEGPYTAMLCEDCALAKYYEALEEEEE